MIASRSKTLRIALVTGRFPVVSETFVINIAKGLLDGGHDLDILSTQEAPQTEPAHSDVLDCGLLERLTPLWQHGSTKLTPTNFLWPMTKLALLDRHLAARVWRCYRQERPVFKRFGFRMAAQLASQQFDIVHAQFGPQGNFALPLRTLGLFPGKLITSFRGYDVSSYVQREGPEIYRALFQHGDYFLPNCNFFKRRLIDLGCDERRIHVYRSGVDCERFSFHTRRPPEDRPIRLLTVGRLVEKKGIEYTIRAVAAVARDFPQLTYQIVGGGPLEDSLRKLILDLGMENRIALLGAKNQVEILSAYHEADLFLACSVTAADGNQDAPVNVLKEAMATGLPVISTWHGGIPELVEDGKHGFLVPERDVGAIEQRLRLLLSIPQRWPQWGKAGRETVETHYNLRTLDREIVDFYHHALQG